MKLRTKQVLSVVLSLVGSAGTIATAILTRKAAKEEEKIKQYLKEENEQLSKKEFFLKYSAKIYIPTAVVGLATIASTISSTILNRRAEASLAAMALLADQGWRKYKGQVKEKLGFDTHSDILKSLGKRDRKRIKEQLENDGKELYFEDHIGFFRADPEKFALAYSDLNQRLQLEEYGVSSHYTMLYDLIKAAEADLENEDLDIKNLRWGWSAEYLKKTCGYVWVHLTMFDTMTEDDLKFKTIVWGEDPYLDPGNFGETFINKDESQKEPHQFKSAIPKNKEVVIDYGN